MQQLSQPHIESFNYLLTEGLQHIAEHTRPVEFKFQNARLSIAVTSLEITKPKQPGSTRNLFPSECRRSGKTYSGSLIARLQISVDGTPITQLERNFGDIPVMVRSRACNLHGRNEKELMAVNEEPRELGGYFIVNGNERVIRMIVLPRRNFPICCNRISFKKRGRGYTESAVIIRCVARDQTSHINILHWRVFGEPVLNFSLQREQFYAPVALILRALADYADMEICEEVLRGSEDSLSLQQTVLVMLTRLSDPKFSTRERALNYLGQHFRHKLGLPEWYTDLEVGKFLLNESILTHLNDHKDKFMLLTYMIRKLHAYVRENCCLESNDRAVFQEAMLPGHIYLQLIKEKVEVALLQLRKLTLMQEKPNQRASGSRRVSKAPTDSGTVASLIAELTSRLGKGITRALVYFLATGNLVARSGMGLMQTTGLVIPLDNINFLRVASNFRALHRGAFFTQMRTTEVRKLLPEVYGFICPVHTPDGPPCGLLNHLSINCRIINRTFLKSAKQQLMDLLIRCGLWSAGSKRRLDPPLHLWLSVLFDGRVIGWLSVENACQAENDIRLLKISDDRFAFMEVCLVPRTQTASQYAGLYIFTDVARLMRPVLNLSVGKREWIGTFEQPYLSIAHAGAEDIDSQWTHQEEKAENLFSFVASLTPYPDYNQSPRNMYQCQMGKQTMGHSCYTWRSRSDIKSYRLLTPQSPLLKTKTYEEYEVDTYPLGFNAIVAVMSYTAYDMEDAMIINQASYDRGFAHACIYKSEVIDLLKKSEQRSPFSTYDTTCSLQFGVGPNFVNDHKFDDDGFLPIGYRLQPGDGLYAYYHSDTGKTEVVKYKGDQPAFVEAISFNGNRHQATITLRIQRLPDIGDKFSSRHGQKGVNSILMPPEDMPWTDSGMVPDLIFNPHGIPSRMTIGKLIEFLGGKVSAITGNKIDCTPFQRDENDPPYYDFMKILKSRGYNYYGTETFYSGSTGEPIEAEIFMGVVYYQRLRHMVADKWQVRSTGGYDFVTRQPTKGRKVGGGVRLGEMERDCLLSHGAPAILNERMFVSCSDRTSALVCRNCGSMVDISFRKSSRDVMMQLMSSTSERFRRRWRCTACDKSSQNLMRVTIPHVLRMLAQELTAMNVRMRFEGLRIGESCSAIEEDKNRMLLSESDEEVYEVVHVDDDDDVLKKEGTEEVEESEAEEEAEGERRKEEQDDEEEEEEVKPKKKAKRKHS